MSKTELNNELRCPECGGKLYRVGNYRYIKSKDRYKISCKCKKCRWKGDIYER